MRELYHSPKRDHARRRVSPVIAPMHPPATLTIGLTAPLAPRPRSGRAVILALLDAEAGFLALSVVVSRYLANNGFELTRSAMARGRGPRSSTQCWTDR
jgi:hypothetical protein